MYYFEIGATLRNIFNKYRAARFLQDTKVTYIFCNQTVKIMLKLGSVRMK